MRLRHRLLLVWLLALAIAATAHAQIPAALQDRIAAIYQRGEFAADSLGTPAWLDGGRRYTVLTRGTIVAYDTASGQSEVLVTSQALTPKGAASPLSISDYSWSSDGSKLLIFTNTRRVWRLNTRGDYW